MISLYFNFLAGQTAKKQTTDKNGEKAISNNGLVNLVFRSKIIFCSTNTFTFHNLYLIPKKKKNKLKMYIALFSLKCSMVLCDCIYSFEKIEIVWINVTFQMPKLSPKNMMARPGIKLEKLAWEANAVTTVLSASATTWTMTICICELELE